MNGSIKLSQKQLIKELLGDFGMNECSSTKSPLETGRLERCDGKCGEEERTDGTKFRSCVGKLNYLASTTRPDLSFSVSYLSQNNKCPHREHMVAAKRVLRYLKGTEDRGVEYTQNSKDIEVYSNADYANDTEDSRSYTGSIVKMSGGPVAWESKKQPTVALSSTEAEYMALTSTAKEVMYIRNLLDELNMEEHYGAADIEILCDNNSSINLAENRSSQPL